MSPEFSQQMGMAARKFDLVALNIKDAREEQLNGSGLFRLWDQERGVERVVDLGSRSAQGRFADYARRRDEQLKSLFNRYGVDCVDIDTGSDYIKPLSLFFRSRAKRL